MYYAPTDIAERNAYVDKTIEECLLTLENPEIVHYLGDKAEHFKAVLQDAAVPNINHGVVSVPESVTDDSLLITAVRENEPVYCDTTWGNRTPFQKANIIAVFDSWQPRSGDATEIFESNYGPDAPGDLVEVFISEREVAQTFSVANIVGGKTLKHVFSKSPSKGLAFIQSRPQVLLKMQSNDGYTQPDAVAHELVHVDQIAQHPLQVFRSQEHIDSYELRVELEAYHIGAIVTGHILATQSRTTPLDLSALARTYQGTQIAINTLREQVGFHPTDPYNPTKRMKMAIAQHGLGYILHTALEYAALLEQTRRL